MRCRRATGAARSLSADASPLDPLRLARHRPRQARGSRGMAKSRVAGVLGGAFLLAALAVPAGAADPFEKNFWMSGPRYDGVLPPCEHTYVLERIQERFSSKE